MKLFIDASALVAVLGEEPGYERLAIALDEADSATTSPIAIWEASVALARLGGRSFAAAEQELRTFLNARRIGIEMIDSEQATGALAAFERFGKLTRHPARLNMGDCFAYACAKANGAVLLYKGDDFARTDLA